jgi:hypothetical protein
MENPRNVINLMDELRESLKIDSEVTHPADSSGKKRQSQTSRRTA